MVTLLVNLFIQEKEDVQNPQVRQQYGMLCGLVGIILNILLFLGKFLAGLMSHSISITADAFNNLSDAGSSCVTLVGFKMAGAKPDVDHPFGHGRIEYIAGLIVSGAILVMAFELVKGSVEKILKPEPVVFNLLIFWILLASIFVKIYMAFYNYKIGKKLTSAAMRATAIDSLSDTCATTVVLIGALVGRFTGVQIDGWCGVLVGLFIFYAGISAAKDTLNPLLGQPPEEEFVCKIEEIVLAYEEICGIHDVVDNAEMELRKNLNCEAVIHMDPVVTQDAYVLELKSKIEDLIKEIDSVLTMHDFRVVAGQTHTNLIFDVVVPYKFYISDEALSERIQRQVGIRIGENYFVVIQVDKAYIK